MMVQIHIQLQNPSPAYLLVEHHLIALDYVCRGEWVVRGEANLQLYGVFFELV